MPAQFFNDPATTTVNGSLTVQTDARTGDVGTITAVSLTSSAAAAAAGVTLPNNVAIASLDATGGLTTKILQHNASDSTSIRSKVGAPVVLQDAGATSFLTASAALFNIQSTALQATASPTVPTPTGAAQTIATNTGIISRTAPSGACTNAIMQAGTVNGQICIVTNENIASTTNIITFNTTIATANVLNDGTNPQVIKCGTAKAFVWVTALSAWVALAPFAG